MIWLIWRQQRTEVVIFTVIMALVGILVLKSGIDMASSFQHLGVGACVGAPVSDPRCGDILSLFHQHFDPLNTLFEAFELAPIALALLLAAPYVQDLEQGTYRLALTQGITRLRWLLVRTGILVAGAALTGFLCSAIMTWWHGPLNHLSGAAFSYISFDTQGLVPAAYAVFALTLVLALGTLLRRTVPALAISLAAYSAVRAAVEVLARPRYLPPIDRVWITGPMPVGPQDWVLSKGEIYRDRLGHFFSFDQVNQLCGNPSANFNLSPAAAKDAYIACFDRHGLAEIVRYQPAGRYWLFQGLESGIFLSLAAALLGFTIWVVRHRLN